ncbi:GDT1-like protein 1, chloroplastic isoform X2 [Zingiber officinale]|uniref:GDT1-like protein 1, chloroplastic isoform X2 n=1 Tax=Zingiber officinale TaxID=94328 RepID=UPI001C4BF835|nr:GDT1-like protein 1, chloroplastic isoform X2 [Zingiber officinale]
MPSPGADTVLPSGFPHFLKVQESYRFWDRGGNIAAASTVLSTFILVFVAEWGDMSFFSTIELATASSPLGVIGGALAGHAFATLVKKRDII